MSSKYILYLSYISVFYPNLPESQQVANLGLRIYIIFTKNYSYIYKAQNICKRCSARESFLQNVA